ncbi:BBE domain-containing protein [Haladaptatus sp. W1]|nr:BBE domain-containing protein [Haladaptatus sp. W1]
MNFTTEPEGEQSMAYRENYERLVALKNEWDPDNLFKMDQNIKPTC